MYLGFFWGRYLSILSKFPSKDGFSPRDSLIFEEVDRSEPTNSLIPSHISNLILDPSRSNSHLTNYFWSPVKPDKKKQLDTQAIPQILLEYFSQCFQQFTGPGENFTRKGVKQVGITIPETWRSTLGYGKLNIFSSILLDLQVPIKKLISEPLAAGAYYIWKNKRFNSSSERILVLNLGEGKFEIAELGIKEGAIWLMNFESSEHINFLSNSDVNELDLGLIHMYKRIKRDSSSHRKFNIPHPGAFNQKIFESQTLKKLTLGYPLFLEDPKLFNHSLFSFKEYEVWYSDVYAAIDQLRKSVEDTLEQFFSGSGRKRKYRAMLLLGDLIHFPLIQQSIKAYLPEDIPSRNQYEFPQAEAKRIFAYGAAIIARGLVYSVDTLPFGISLLKETPNGEKEEWIIRRYRQFSYNKPIWSAVESVFQQQWGSLIGKIHINSKNRLHFAVDTHLPFTIHSPISCRIGVKIDHSNQVYLLLKYGSWAVHEVPLLHLDPQEKPPKPSQI